MNQPINPPAITNVVALAGGVGGARLADGLAQVLARTSEPGHLCVIVNVGDDFEHLGLNISPDLDTVCYTLAGLGNPETGWGLKDESFRVMTRVERLGGPTWFNLGDLDLATHLLRTQRLRAGEPLSIITADLCRALGIEAQVLPVTDDHVPTIVETENESLAFQEYFVHQRCEPRVSGFQFAGAKAARPAPGVLEAIAMAQAVVICPSNPWVSVDPILAIPGVRQALQQRSAAGTPILAVSPIIGGKTVKGPAAKMYAELGIEPSALAVARHYGSLLCGYVLDDIDVGLAAAINDLFRRAQSNDPEKQAVLVTNTIMQSREDRACLAEEILRFAASLAVKN